MFSMRSTTALSLLGLVVGIAGTTWLTALTYDREPLAARHAAAATSPRHAADDPSRSAARASSMAVPVVAAGSKVADVPALVPVYMPSPRYPMSALRAQREGQVVLSVTVTPSGDVTHVAVGRSSGDIELDRAAEQAVRTWRFAQVESRPASYTAELPIRFELTRGL
ncbi:TonB family protein [Luteibacter rhizovicinus]|uniref:TonB family protein n=1 Tax=Luteibacter rhizovicinus TaxID=242606 RepID=A0A4R3YYA5_9GAMM|nr:energy transducer TonB [Luteibacter rhizovicinus]TCV96333.1 TonB family protein [Luteibacter rhizovicinus]